MMQQEEPYGAAAADNDERQMHSTDSNAAAAAGSSMVCASASSASASASREGDSAYRQVERQFKLAPASAAAAVKAGSSSKRARKAAAASASAAASAASFAATQSDATPASQRYATEFARWQADTIDLHDVSNNTPANRARIVRHEIARGPHSSTEQHPAADATAHTAAASSSPVASASPSSSWLSPQASLFSMVDIPGFFVLRGALDLNAQSWWAWHSLRNYSRATYTNLSNLQARKAKEQPATAAAATAASASAADKSASASMEDASAAASSSSSSSAASAASAAAGCTSSPSSALWSNYCRTGDDRPFRALRWSCLGYSYDWSAREYSPAMREDFPPELGALSAELAAACGFSSLLAEAAIVNYYPGSASMGGHIDDAELTKLHPIVSISLGCTAVFLLGGPQKTQRPQAFYLRSGDVAIMGGESRVCYHGVPRILEGSFGDAELQQQLQTEERASEHAHEMHTPSVQQLQSQEECKESSSPASEEGQCSKKQKSSLSGGASIAIDRSRSSSLSTQQPQQPWSAERCYDRLRLDSTGQPLFPSAATAAVSGSAVPSVPTRSDLLCVYRFLRRSRLNLNVRQVEDETFTYAAGLSSAACREMKLQEQRSMAAAAQKQEPTNNPQQTNAAAASMQA